VLTCIPCLEVRLAQPDTLAGVFLLLGGVALIQLT
jgi:hypothetical protein